MTNGSRAMLGLVVVALTLPLGSRLEAQAPPPSIDEAISHLASGIAEPLEKAHVRKVIVADITGPQGQAHPVGRWLADQISRALEGGFPGLQMIPRPTPLPFSSEEPGSGASITGGLGQAESAAQAWAEHSGAHAVVTGRLARVGHGIAVSLKALDSSGVKLELAQEWAVLPSSETILAIAKEPLPEMAPGIPSAGLRGFGIPECFYCPAPGYTNEARKDKLMGTVAVQVTVAAGGKVSDVYVWKALGDGLDARAVEVLKTWKFTPALGPDGKPTTVTVPIEVTFRLY